MSTVLLSNGSARFQLLVVRFQAKLLSNTQFKCLLLTWHRTRARIKNKTEMFQDKAFDEIKSSAALSLGRMEHSNLSGCLENPTLNLKKQLWERKCTYMRTPVPGAIATSTGISFPFSSFAIFTSNTERIDEATRKSVASTR